MVKVIVQAFLYFLILLLPMLCKASDASSIRLDDKHFADNIVDQSIKMRFEQTPPGSSEKSHRIREEQLRLDFLTHYLRIHVNSVANDLISFGFKCTKAKDEPNVKYRCYYNKGWIARITSKLLLGIRLTVREECVSYLFIYDLYTDGNELVDVRVRYKPLENSYVP